MSKQKPGGSIKKFQTCLDWMLQDRNDQSPIVVMVTQVDPDAIGGALVLTAMLEDMIEERGKKVSVLPLYCGGIGHPQNRALFNRYDLGRRFGHVNTYSSPISDRRLVLVDSSDLNDSRLPSALRGKHPAMIIDHHRSEAKPKGKEFYWIEDGSGDGVGSSSTMVFELAHARNFKIGDTEQMLLALGIHNDTKSLVDSTERDRLAFATLSADIDGRKFSELIRYPLPESYFSALSRALTEMRHVNERLVTNVGSIGLDDGDNISTIADFLLRMVGVTFVVVWGVVGKKVRLSLRSTDPSFSLTRFITESFGQNTGGAKMTPEGISEGGATVSLELPDWIDVEDEALEQCVEGMVSKAILGKVFPNNGNGK
ncbi:MAG: DHH family phosphoesterase [Patescibacteria group bacterium]|mgnify:CR=1 FL=1